MCMGLLLGVFAIWLLRGQDITFGNQTLTANKASISGAILLIAAGASAAGELLRIISESTEMPMFSLVGDAASLVFLIATPCGLLFAGYSLFSAPKIIRGKNEPVRASRDPDMILCPKCKFEQWKGYTECQKCGLHFA